MTKTALIVGCGYLGNALGALLLARDWQVWGLRREPGGMAAGIQPLAADICRPEQLRRVLDRDFDAVVVCAGAGGRDPQRYRALYLEGLGNVLAALGGVGLLLLASSTRVYHQDDGSPVDETSPTRPREFAGRILLQAEELARTAAPACVVRFGGIYGPGRTGLLRALREGGARTRDAMTMTNRIHREDGAGALAHLMALHTQGVEIAPLYLGVDCAPTPLWQLRQWLTQQPGAAPAKAPPQQQAPDSGGKTSAPLRGKACSNARLLATGYRFRFPDYRSGYAALLRNDGATAE